MVKKIIFLEISHKTIGISKMHNHYIVLVLKLTHHNGGVQQKQQWALQATSPAFPESDADVGRAFGPGDRLYRLPCHVKTLSLLRSGPSGCDNE